MLALVFVPGLSFVHLVEGVFLEKIALLDVAVHHFFGFVPRLPHDGQGVQVVLGGTGGKAPAQAVPGEIIGVQPQPCHVFLDDGGNRLVVELGVPGLQVALEATEQGACGELCGINPCPHCPDGADIPVRRVGNSYLAAGTHLVTLGLGDEDHKPLGGEGQILYLHSHQLRAAEGSCKAQEQQCPVPEGNQVLACQHICQKGQGFHENWGLAVLEGALFPADCLHGVVHHDMLGRIAFLIACGNVVFGDGGYPPGDGVCLGMVRQVVDVVDYILRLAGQGTELRRLAPVSKVIPVSRVGFQGVV